MQQISSINNAMSNTANSTPVIESTQTQTQTTAQRPHETGTISVEAHMRIFDPNTQKTHVEGRA